MPFDNMDTDVQQEKKPKKNGLLIALIIIAVVLIVLPLFCLTSYIFLARINNRNSTPTTRANGNAASLYKATNSAFTELDEEGYNVSGFFIICSDSEKNYNVPDTFDVDEFSKKVNKFFDDSNKMKWFAVCEEGDIYYIAQSKKWDAEIVGTFPYGTNDEGPIHYYIDPDDTREYHPLETAKRGKATLKELYDDAVNEVRTNPVSKSSKE